MAVYRECCEMKNEFKQFLDGRSQGVACDKNNIEELNETITLAKSRDQETQSATSTLKTFDSSVASLKSFAHDGKT